MSEDQPCTDGTGFLKCPCCGARAMLLVVHSVDTYFRWEQAEPGRWELVAGDPVAHESAPLPYLVCEACKRLLGRPNQDLVDLLRRQARQADRLAG